MCVNIPLTFGYVVNTRVTGIRQRLRSAAKSGGSTIEEDVGRHKSTLSTAYKGGSEPGPLHRLHTEAMFSRTGSAMSLGSLFDSEVEEAATEEVVTTIRQSPPETDVAAAAKERCEGCAPPVTSSERLVSLQEGEQPNLAEKWSTFDYSEPAPQKYSWTGRSRYAAPGVMTDRLPLNPAIPELIVEDDVGTWVTFDVPAGHHLYGMFVPVDRAALPADIPVQRVMGNVFGRATKPTMKQIEEAVEATHMK